MKTQILESKCCGRLLHGEPRRVFDFLICSPMAKRPVDLFFVKHMKNASKSPPPTKDEPAVWSDPEYVELVNYADEPVATAKSTRYFGTAKVEDDSFYSKQNRAEQEQKKERRRVYFVLALLWAAAIILFLLLLFDAIFFPLYNDHEVGEVEEDLKRKINGDFGSLNQTIFNDFTVLNNTIASLGGIYVGYALPSSSVGNPNSLYIRNGTNTMYYKTNNTTWSLVLNATSAPLPTPCVFNVTEGVVYDGGWNSTVVYQNGTLVVYNSYLYISNQVNYNVTPAGNNTIWTILYSNITGPQGPNGTQGPVGPPGQPLVFSGTWNNMTTYTNAEVVIYNNTLYIALMNNTNDPPPTDPASWTMFLANITGPTGPIGPKGDTGPPGTSIGFDGSWNATSNYTIGNVVVYNNAVYISVVSNNTDMPPNNSTAWAPLIYNITGAPGAAGTNGTDGTSVLYDGPWNVSSAYVPGSVVLYNSSLFVTNQNTTGDVPGVGATWTLIFSLTPGAVGPPGFNGTNGANGLGIVFDGVWNATQSYGTNGLVLYNNTAYIALQNNTGSVPTSNSSNWAQFSFCQPGLPGAAGANGTDGVGVMFYGIWNSTYSYGPSNLVIYNNSLYIAYVGSTADSPGNYSMIWALVATGLVGPDGAPGTAGINGTNGMSVMFYGNWTASSNYTQGSIVMYNGTAYIANLPNSNVSPPSNTSDWTAIASSIPGAQGANGVNGTNGANGTSALFEGYWNNTIVYPGSSIVIYNNSLYFSYVSNLNVPPYSNSSIWALVATNLTGAQGPIGPQGLNGTDAMTDVYYTGSWNASLSYVIGNVVLYNNSIYIADQPSTGVSPSTNSSVWNFVFGSVDCLVGPQGPPGTNGTDGTSVMYTGAWNVSIAYAQSNVVLYNNSLWVTSAAISGVPPGTANSTWTQIQSIVGPQGLPGADGTSMGFEGTWNSTQIYAQSQLVIYNNTLYVSSTPNTDVTPGTNSSVWTTILPTINCTQGPQGVQGDLGTSVGANTIRISTGGPLSGTKVPATTTLVYQPVPMNGQYRAGPVDPTAGDRWSYFPLLSNQTAGITNLKTEFTWLVNLCTNVTAQLYLSITMTGTPVGGGGPVTNTVCTTGGLMWMATTVYSGGANVMLDIYYRFNYILTTITGGSSVVCIGNQIGTNDNLPNGIYANSGLGNINPPNTFSVTNSTIDLTQPYYFQFLSAYVIVPNPAAGCGANYTIAGMATTTNEFVIGSAN